MAESATSTQKFKNDDENFPILYEDRSVQVYRSTSNEIFVEDRYSGVTIRIHTYPLSHGGLQFTTEARVEPIPINNMIGWRITPR